MSCARSSAFRFELQLPFLYDTTTLRSYLRPAILHQASQRRRQSTDSRAIHDTSGTAHPAISQDVLESATTSPSTPPTHVIHTLLSDVLARSEKLRHQKTNLGEAPRRTSFLRQKAQSVTAGRAEVDTEDEGKKQLPRTITGLEKAIFRQIFNNLAKGKPVTTSLSEYEATPRETADSSFDLDDFLHNVNVDLILNELYGSSAGRKDESAYRQETANVSREDVEKYPKALRRMALKARAAVIARSGEISKASEMSAETGSQDSDPKAVDAQKLCLEALQKISQEIKRVLTTRQDREQALIEVCEQYVFRLMPSENAMEALGYPRKAIVAQRKAVQAKRKNELKKAAQESSQSQAIQPSPVLEDAGLMYSMSRELHLPGDDMTIPENIPPLEILSTLCPAAVVLAVRYLASECPNSSLLSSFLSTLHAMGPEAYVLGSSTALYNTLLAHTWIQYSDLQAMEHILMDMRAGAVAFDLNTIHILDVIREERFFALSKGYLGDTGTDDQTLRPTWWWQLGSTAMEFRRVTEDWRQIIANALEDSEASEDIPEMTYSDDMLESLRQESSKPAVLL